MSDGPDERPDGGAGSGWVTWLDWVPVAWLVVVLSGYALLAAAPLAPVRAEVPGIHEAERVLPVLLAALVAAAIIRASCLRQRDRASGHGPGGPPEGGGNAS